MRHVRSVIAGLVAAGLFATATAAAEPSYFTDPIYDSPLFNFEGFYAGVQAGGGVVPGPGLVGVAGVAIGANFMLSEAILAGLEFQGNVNFNGGVTGVDALLLARVGGFLTNDLMIYAAGGGGVVNGAGSYALGGGLELPISSPISVRGELLGTGTWGAMPNGARLTGGLLWHMN